MAVGRITKRSVEAIEPLSSGARNYLWDDGLKGFAVMVMPSGVRSYIVQYRIGGRGGKLRRYTIGRHGAPWTADKARERAADVLEKVRRKIDPVDEERQVLAAAKSDEAKSLAAREIEQKLGFSVFADRFMDEYAKPNQPRTWRQTQSAIDLDLRPAFGDTPLTSITDADIVELFPKIKRRAPSASRRAYTALKLIFKHACNVERRHLPPTSNPMVGIEPPWKATARERTLSDWELRLLWLAAGELEWPYQPIVRLLILLGQRTNEVGGMLTAELDFRRKEWVIPGERTKNKVTHMVPLSPPVLKIIRDLSVPASTQGWYFTTTGHSAFSHWDGMKKWLDERMLRIAREEAEEAGASEEELAKIQIKPWVFHDIRRTLPTGCQGLGFPIEHTEATINHLTHLRSGLKGVYHLYEYAKEKRQVLNRWAEYVMDLVSMPDAAFKEKWHPILDDEDDAEEPSKAAYSVREE